MKFEHLQGSIVAMVTPFCQDGSVNFDMLTELLERQIAAGTDGILTLGTTGEYSTMSHEEDAAVVEHTIRVVDGRVPAMWAAAPTALSPRSRRAGCTSPWGRMPCC